MPVAICCTFKYQRLQKKVELIKVKVATKEMVVPLYNVPLVHFRMAISSLHTGLLLALTGGGPLQLIHFTGL
jgi:hypothetical protein